MLQFRILLLIYNSHNYIDSEHRKERDYNIMCLDQWTQQPFYKCCAAFPDWLREAELVFLPFSVSGGNSEGGAGKTLAGVSQQKEPRWYFLLIKRLTFYTSCSVSQTHTHKIAHTGQRRSCLPRVTRGSS